MTHCPRDQSTLVTSANAFGAGRSASQCPTCTGVLAEWKTAQVFFESIGLTLGELKSAVDQGTPVPAANPPPTCVVCAKAPMATFRIKGVELDLCAECGATWFDADELHRLSSGKLGAPPKTTAAAPALASNEKVVGVYEMWWDCSYCGTTALLAKSNRHCPQCGAAQVADRRYFPPPGREQAINTTYEGADRTCPACSTPNGAKATHCRQCGSPLDGSAHVARVADRQQQRAAQARPASAGKGWGIKLAIVVGLLVVSVCSVAVFWKKDAKVTVAGHRWNREIDIEAFGPKSDSAWCDSMPSDAYGISRSREQRSTKKIPDGEECTTRDVDRGDGTFERRQSCKPKYREEPIYDDKCRYTIDRWQKSRSVTAKGAALSESPKWPALMLRQAGNCRGCEREGARRETYSVDFKGPEGEAWSCDFPEAKWKSFAVSSAHNAKVRVLVSLLDCSSL